MRKANGYGVAVDRFSGKVAAEHDFVQCGHCGRHDIVKPKQDPNELGGFCRMCMKHICPDCVRYDRCFPFERSLEVRERRARFSKDIGLVEK